VRPYGQGERRLSQHLTGDRRNQRRHRELLALLDALIRDTESAAKSWARDMHE
jgi:hypothetical protein